MMFIFSQPAVIWIARAALSRRGLTAEQINDRTRGPWRALFPAGFCTGPNKGRSECAFCLYFKCKHTDLFGINSHQEMDYFPVVVIFTLGYLSEDIFTLDPEECFKDPGQWGIQALRTVGLMNLLQSKHEWVMHKNSCFRSAFVYVDQIWYLPCSK